jgi:predicted CoA-binding protein
MPTRNETFFCHSSYAFVGHSKKKPFPQLSFGALKERKDKTVFAVDPSVDRVAGERTYPDLASLPQKVDGVVLEVPKEETLGWVEKAAKAEIGNVWIHMGRETPEALELAREKGMNVFYGTCAVMYVRPGFSYHAVHRGLNKLLGKY